MSKPGVKGTNNNASLPNVSLVISDDARGAGDDAGRTNASYSRRRVMDTQRLDRMVHRLYTPEPYVRKTVVDMEKRRSERESGVVGGHSTSFGYNAVNDAHLAEYWFRRKNVEQQHKAVAKRKRKMQQELSESMTLGSTLNDTGAFRQLTMPQSAEVLSLTSPGGNRSPRTKGGKASPSGAAKLAALQHAEGELFLGHHVVMPRVLLFLGEPNCGALAATSKNMYRLVDRYLAELGQPHGGSDEAPTDSQTDDYYTTDDFEATSPHQSGQSNQRTTLQFSGDHTTDDEAHTAAGPHQHAADQQRDVPPVVEDPVDRHEHRHVATRGTVLAPISQGSSRKQAQTPSKTMTNITIQRRDLTALWMLAKPPPNFQSAIWRLGVPATDYRFAWLLPMTKDGVQQEEIETYIANRPMNTVLSIPAKAPTRFSKRGSFVATPIDAKSPQPDSEEEADEADDEAGCDNTTTTAADATNNSADHPTEDTESGERGDEDGASKEKSSSRKKATKIVVVKKKVLRKKKQQEEAAKRVDDDDQYSLDESDEYSNSGDDEAAPKTKKKDKKKSKSSPEAAAKEEGVKEKGEEEEEEHGSSEYTEVEEEVEVDADEGHSTAVPTATGTRSSSASSKKRPPLDAPAVAPYNSLKPDQFALTSPRSALILMKNGVRLRDIVPKPLSVFKKQGELEGVQSYIIEKRYTSHEERRQKLLREVHEDYRTLCGKITLQQTIDMLLQYQPEKAAGLSLQEDSKPILDIQNEKEEAKNQSMTSGTSKASTFMSPGENTLQMQKQRQRDAERLLQKNHSKMHEHLKMTMEEMIRQIDRVKKKAKAEKHRAEEQHRAKLEVFTHRRERANQRAHKIQLVVEQARQQQLEKQQKAIRKLEEHERAQALLNDQRKYAFNLENEERKLRIAEKKEEMERQRRVDEYKKLCTVDRMRRKMDTVDSGVNALKALQKTMKFRREKMDMTKHEMIAKHRAAMIRAQQGAYMA